MTIWRRAARRDDNEAEIVRALELVGVLVIRLAKPVDLLCGVKGRWVLLEVKDGSKPPSDQKLTPAQRLFLTVAHDRGLPVAVVSNITEALRAVEALR